MTPMPSLRNAIQGLNLTQRATLQGEPASHRRPAEGRPGRQVAARSKMPRPLVSRQPIQGDIRAPALKESVEI
eukprot:3983974-Alexandrium_andersonii.AAC.1